MRYGENVDEALADPNWTCPTCRDICNCSIHRNKRGWAPTGTMYRAALSEGYASVAHYIVLNKADPDTIKRVLSGDIQVAGGYPTTWAESVNAAFDSIQPEALPSTSADSTTTNVDSGSTPVPTPTTSDTTLEHSPTEPLHTAPAGSTPTLKRTFENVLHETAVSASEPRILTHRAHSSDTSCDTHGTVTDDAARSTSLHTTVLDVNGTATTPSKKTKLATEPVVGTRKRNFDSSSPQKVGAGNAACAVAPASKPPTPKPFWTATSTGSSKRIYLNSRYVTYWFLP